MKTKPQITPEQAAELEQRTLANVIERIGAGAVPTNREIEMLRAATAEPPPPASPADAEVESASYGARLNLKQLARLTGKTRETIAQRLASLTHATGKTGAKLYTAKDALEAIYTAASTSEAESRRHLNDARRELTTLQAEALRKARVPLDDAIQINEAALANVRGILKSRLGKTFDEQTLGDTFAELATIGKGIAELGLTETAPAPTTRKKKQ